MPEFQLSLELVHVVSLLSSRNDFTLIQEYICLIRLGPSKLSCALSVHSTVKSYKQGYARDVFTFMSLNPVVESHFVPIHSHHNIWREAQIPRRTFRYYHPDSKGLNFVALMDDIKVQ